MPGLRRIERDAAYQQQFAGAMAGIREGAWGGGPMMRHLRSGRPGKWRRLSSAAITCRDHEDLPFSDTAWNNNHYYNTVLVVAWLLPVATIGSNRP
jgi:hypothetical protein